MAVSAPASKARGASKGQTKRKARTGGLDEALLFRQNPLPMWIHDPRTLAFLDVNGAAIARYGYSRGEFLSMTLAQIRQPPDGKASQKAILGAEGRECHVLRNGEVIAVDLACRPVKFGGKQAVLATSVALTGAGDTDNSLTMAERRFRALVEHAPDAIGVVGADGTLIYDSPAAPRLLGYEAGALIGRNAFEFIHPDDIAHVKSLFTRVLTDPSTPVPGLFRFLHHDGSWRWIEATATNLVNEPSVQGVVINYRDVTDREEAQAGLRENEEKFRNLFNNADIGLFRTRLDGSEILDANDKFLQIFGYSRDEMVGAPSVIHWANPDERDAMVRRLRADGHVSAFECDMLTKQGEVRRCLTSLYLYPAQGILEGTILDITAQKQAALRQNIAYQLLRAVSGQLDPDLVARAAAETLAKATGYPHVCIASADEDGTHWVVRGAAGALAAQLGARYSLDMGVIGRALRTGANQWVRDVVEDPSYVRDVAAPEAPALRSEFVALIRIGEGVFGALNIESDRVDAFAEEDSRLFESAAETIALGLTNAQLYGQAQQEIAERKQAEHALRESEERYRGLVEHSPDAIAVHQGGRFVYVNAAALKLMGARDPSELVGRPILDIIHPDYRELVTQRVEQTEGGATVGMVEEKFIKLDGTPIDVEVVAIPLTFEDKAATQVVVHDITERKRTEAEIQALLKIMQGASATENLHDFLEWTRQALNGVLDATNLFVVFHDDETGLFEEVFSVDQYDPPMPPSRLEKSITSYVFHTGKPLRLSGSELDELFSGGEVQLVGRRTASWLGAPLRSGAGVIGVIAVQNYEKLDCYSARDQEFLASVGAHVALALAHRRAADATAASEAELRALFTAMKDVVLVFDEDGRYVRVAPTDSAGLLYRPADELLGKTLHEVYPRAQADEGLARIQEALQRGGPINTEYSMNIGGRDLYFSATVLPLSDRTVLWMAHDITVRKAAEDELRALFAAMTDAVIVLDHDGRYVKIAPTNPAGMLYRPADEMLGKATHEVLPKEQADYILDRIHEALKTRQLVPAEYSLPIGGKDTYFSVNISPLSENTVLLVAHDITNRKIAEESIRARTEEVTSLYELARELASANSLDEALKLAARHAVENVHVTVARFGIQEDGHLAMRAAYPIRVVGHELGLGHRHAMADLPHVQRALRERKVMMLNAGETEIEESERKALLLDFTSQACLVPLWVGEAAGLGAQSLGVLILSEARNPERDPLSQEKIEAAESIGAATATTIRRLLLKEQTESRLRHVVALREIDEAISSSFDLRTVLNVVLGEAAAELGVDAAAVAVLDPASPVLTYASSRGFLGAGLSPIEVSVRESYAGRVVLGREPRFIRNLSSDPDFASLGNQWRDEGFVSYYGVPLVVKGRVRGALEVFQRSPLSPTAEWFDFVASLARQATIAIENSELFESLQRTNAELTAAYGATIEGWSRALDLRDEETEGHTKRVTEMTLRLARHFEFSAEELMQIRWGALLHDIGKMAVPDTILLKPGSLTDEEWAVMKKHPVFARELLMPIRYLHGAVDIPYCHHERWDGSGYPRGLVGTAIPLPARIFAVVDVWDALISDRPYRKAWRAAEALQHIREQSGKHFDPQVVEAFLRLKENEPALSQGA